MLSYIKSPPLREGAERSEAEGCCNKHPSVAYGDSSPRWEPLRTVLSFSPFTTHTYKYKLQDR